MKREEIPDDPNMQPCSQELMSWPREGRKPAVAGTSFCQRNRDLQGGGEGSNPAGQAEKTVTEPTDT